MRLRNGTCRDLEDQADQILKDSYVGVTRRSERGGILTPGMYEARLRKEVYVSSGAPDGRLRQGDFNRAWNSRDPHLNSSAGAARLRRGGAAGVFAESVPEGPGE
jgi:hypothetical protein